MVGNQKQVRILLISMPMIFLIGFATMYTAEAGETHVLNHPGIDLASGNPIYRWSFRN